MAWNSKVKSLGIAAAFPHPTDISHVVGRSLSVDKIDFGPWELYGAMALCSRTIQATPELAKMEPELMAALLGRFVDDTSEDFAIHESADGLKDYWKSTLSGTVAAGIAYLAMVRNDYPWFDHAENLQGGNPQTRRKADFVFAGVQSGVALVEAKGTRSDSLTGFNDTVNEGYVHQVEPHLGLSLGDVLASHGYCIGAHLKSPTRGEILLHHTANQKKTGSGTDFGSIATVQRHSYATAFTLAHGAGLGQNIRSRRQVDKVEFSRFHWRGRSWLSASELYPRGWDSMRTSGAIYAVEEGIARTVLDTYLWADANARQSCLRIQEAVKGRVGTASNAGRDGAIFPNGFATISFHAELLYADRWAWKRADVEAAARRQQQERGLQRDGTLVRPADGDDSGAAG